MRRQDDGFPASRCHTSTSPTTPSQLRCPPRRQPSPNRVASLTCSSLRRRCRLIKAIRTSPFCSIVTMTIAPAAMETPTRRQICCHQWAHRSRHGAGVLSSVPRSNASSNSSTTPMAITSCSWQIESKLGVDFCTPTTSRVCGGRDRLALVATAVITT